MPEAPVKGTEYFKTGDFNFDGYKDIMLLEVCGVTGNEIYKVWLFNPEKIKFESNKFLSQIYSPEFDYDRKEFTTFSKGGGRECYFSTYKYIKRKFVLIKEIRHYPDKYSEKFFEDEYELNNGKIELKSHQEVKDE